MNILDTLSVSKYIAACAKRSGIGVVWEESEKASPRTDGKTMWLPRIGAKMSQDNVVRLMQFVKHETSHIAWSDFGILDEKQPEGLLMYVMNIIEDHRVDYLNDHEFDGDRQNTNEYMALFSKDSKGRTVGKDQAEVFAPLFAWDMGVREDLWLNDGFFESIVAGDGHRILKKLRDGDYAEVLRNVRLITDPVQGGIKGFELACRIVKEVFEQDPKDMQNPGGKKGEEKGEGEEGEGEGEGEGDGEGEDGEGKGKGGEGEGDGDEQDGEGKDGKGKRKKLLTVDMKNALVPYPAHAKPAKGEGVNASNYRTGEGSGYAPTPASDIMITNFVTGEVQGSKSRYIHNDPETEQKLEKLSHNADAVANQLRTQLQIISRDRWEFGKKKGKLNGSALYRVGLKDAKGFNERIFKQQIHSDVLDVAVQVLVDCSGSMSGSKFNAAAAAALILNDVLGNNLRIPTEILGFTEYGPTHAMYVFKEFDRVEAKPTLCKNLASVSSALADNVDGESLVFGYDRLRKRREKRKLMIVLSDGSPCGGHGKGSTQTHTKQVIEAIEKSPIELIGVGIMYDQVRRWYKKHAVISEAKDIGSSLITLISKNILTKGQ